MISYHTELFILLLDLLGIHRGGYFEISVVISREVNFDHLCTESLPNPPLCRQLYRLNLQKPIVHVNVENSTWRPSSNVR